MLAVRSQACSSDNPLLSLGSAGKTAAQPEPHRSLRLSRAARLAIGSSWQRSTWRLVAGGAVAAEGELASRVTREAAPAGGLMSGSAARGRRGLASAAARAGRRG